MAHPLLGTVPLSQFCTSATSCGDVHVYVPTPPIFVVALICEAKSPPGVTQAELGVPKNGKFHVTSPHTAATPLPAVPELLVLSPQLACTRCRSKGKGVFWNALVT